MRASLHTVIGVQQRRAGESEFSETDSPMLRGSDHSAGALYEGVVLPSDSPRWSASIWCSIIS